MLISSQKHRFSFKALAGFVAFMIVLLSPVLSHAQFSKQEFNRNLESSALDDNTVLRSLTALEPLKAPLIYRLESSVADQNDGEPYSGMAVYLGAALPVQISDGRGALVLKPKSGETLLVDGDWVGFKGRFEAVLVQSVSGKIEVSKDTLTVSWPAGVTPDLKIISGIIDEPASAGDELPQLQLLKYAHLPKWLRVLCRFVEWIYTSVQSITGLSWGLSLVLFAIIMKLLLLPAALLTRRFQEQANRHKAALEPIFQDIKKSFKGETAHNKTMAAYKARGITPYYSLKPLLATMISLPFLIAIFNMLGEVHPLKGAPFLWIESLAYPDRLFNLPARFPLFGNALNILPFIMTAVTFLSAMLLKSGSASRIELGRQRRNLYLMGGVFFLLFYPFPSAMVLYWTLSTALQFILNKFNKDQETP